MKIKDRLNSENKAIWDTIQYRDIGITWKRKQKRTAI